MLADAEMSGLKVRDIGHVRLLTIDRPDRRNALDDSTRAGLIIELERANFESGVRVVVLTGSGDRSFCAGKDLKELNDQTNSGREFDMPMRGMQRNLYECVLETFKPTIAAINGAAVGGGFELALACDLRLMSEGAFFRLPEALRGMGANVASVLLPRLLPRAIALEMLYTARAMDSEEALKWGLVNSVHAGDKVLDNALRLAESISVNAPLTTGRYAEMAYKSWGHPMASALRLNVGPNPYLSEDRKEGVRAYNEKRDPRWTGR